MSIEETVAKHPIANVVLEQRKERITTVLGGRTRRITIVLDGVRNYHNISAVLRSADAFGIDTVHLVGNRFEYSAGVSKGAERWINLQTHSNSQAALERVKADGYKVVILQAESKSDAAGPVCKAVHELDFNEKLAFVFGNEYQGISKTFQEAADLHAFIPMSGFVESLNISVTAAIVMYSALFEMGKMREKQLLSETEQNETLDRWLENSIRGGNAILTAVERE